MASTANRVEIELALRDLATAEVSKFGSKLTKAGAQGKKGLSQIDKGAKKATGSLKKLALSVGGVAAAFLVMRAATRKGLDFIKASSAFDENLAKFGVVFGDEALRVGEAIDDLSTKVKRSRSDLITYTSGFQDMLVPMGFARDEAADLSIAFSKLAIDLGSFNNAADTDVMNALKSALAGQIEPMRRYGVFLTQARIQQEAFNIGLVDSGQELTTAQKSLATYSLIIKDSGDALGDAERTSSSFANTIKGIEAGAKDLAVVFGNDLKVAVLDTINALGGTDGVLGLIKVLFGGITAFSKGLIRVLSAVLIKVQDVIEAFGGADTVTSALVGDVRNLLPVVKTAMEAVGKVFSVALAAMAVSAAEGGRKIGQGLHAGLVAAFGDALADSTALDIIGLIPNGNLLVAEIRRELQSSGATEESARLYAGMLLPDPGDLDEKALRSGKMVAELIGDALSPEDVASVLRENADRLKSEFGASADDLIESLGITPDKGSLARIKGAWARVATAASDGMVDVRSAMSENVDVLDFGLSIADALSPQSADIASQVGDVMGPPMATAGENAMAEFLNGMKRAQAAQSTATVDDPSSSSGGGLFGQLALGTTMAVDLISANSDKLVGVLQANAERIAVIQAPEAEASGPFSLFAAGAKTAFDEVLAASDIFAEQLGKNMEKSQTFGANFSKSFGDSFKKFTSAAEVGRQAGADAFGAISGNIDQLSANLVDGTADFGEFAKAMIKDLAQIAIRSLILKSLGGIFGGGGGGGVGGPDPAALFAKGGVMPGNKLGSVPINAYAGGGVANTPQLAVFGEGRGAEAYVPLPDGKRIPVAMEGGGGGGPVQVTIQTSSLDPSRAADVIRAQIPQIVAELTGALEGGRFHDFNQAVGRTRA